MEKLSDFKLGMGVVIKADKDCVASGGLQVAMHWQLPRYLVLESFASSVALVVDRRR